MVHEVTITGMDGASHSLRIELAADGRWHVSGSHVSVESSVISKNALTLIAGHASYDVRHDVQNGKTLVLVNGNRFEVEVRDPRSLRGRRNTAAAGDGPQKIKAPMPGKVVRILQTEGSHVELGQGIIVIEAMKMQNELKSPKAGTVKKINFKESDT